jgi:hypothetical protein
MLRRSCRKLYQSLLRAFEAIESLHDVFVRPLTAEEKEREKVWMDERLGFKGLWREGWVMYDGTIVVLHERPAMHGDAYYTRKANYGLNVQVNQVLVVREAVLLTVASYRLGTFHPIYGSLTTHMASLVLHITQLLLSTPVQQNTRTSSFRGKSLHGVTLRTP